MSHICHDLANLLCFTREMYTVMQNGSWRWLSRLLIKRSVTTTRTSQDLQVGTYCVVRGLNNKQRFSPVAVAMGRIDDPRKQ